MADTCNAREHVQKSINLLCDEIAKEERATDDKKRIVNNLCEAVGLPCRFAGIDETHQRMRGDEFYGQHLADAVEGAMMVIRGQGRKSETVVGLYEIILACGFVFKTKTEENARRAIYNVMREDARFHRLPNGSYGLTSWYPKRLKDDDPDTESSIGASDGEEATESDSN